MSEENDLKITLRDLILVLKNQRVSFHLTGGLASSYYGEPRFTQDIDIVIRLDIGESLDQLVTEISQKFIIDAVVAEDSVRRKTIFQALHNETMIKVDFHVGEAIPGELSRSKTQEILSGIVLPIVSKEDAILSKLVWISKGSSKSRQDAISILKRSGVIDWNYLNNQATQLGVDEILHEIKENLNSEKIR